MERRQFLRLVAGLGAAALEPACSQPSSVPYYPKVTVPATTPEPHATPKAGLTRSSTETRTIQTEKTWFVSDPERAKVLLGDPEFYTETWGTGAILTGERDPKQFEVLNVNKGDLAIKNSCGLTVLKMAFDAASVLKTGKITGVTTGERINILAKSIYSIAGISYPFLQENYTMYPLSLMKAFDFFDPERKLVSVFAIRKLQSPIDNQFYYEESEGPKILADAQRVFDKGGFLCWQGLKYGRAQGLASHFVLITSLSSNQEANSPLATIVDPLGNFNTPPYGKVWENEPLLDFWQDSADGKIKRPIISVFGIVPSYS